jgi:hypothetical protein
MYIRCMYINFFDSTDSLTYFTLAKQSRELGAYKLARYAYDKLQVMHTTTVVSWVNVHGYLNTTHDV